ncbi:hypothetical protein E6Q11_02560 [Candidatus Dojkabacteria bacterium]|uniref:Uncharacterized protein n=1 Tax=Candidatus Dojkabacteria bacterium TaxID=2099670 RepID=A0A5C7J7X4_9BACT|nr:MAG: hypothetical protein E6Q11_02560 [Candidatus Dojkabacteria bacterium]
MNHTGFFKSSVLDATYEVNSSGVLQPRTTNADFKVQGNGTGKFFIHGLQYPTADGSANFPIKSDGAGVLSVGTISPTATVFLAGSEGQVLYVNNTSPSGGIANDTDFVYSATLKGARLGPDLADTYSAYSTNFLSRFWAVSIPGFLSTFILEHRGAGASEQANFIFGKTNGTFASRGDVLDGDGLGAFFWQGWKTGTFANAASIQIFVDGTPSIYSVPGRIQLSVTKAGTFFPIVVQDIRSDYSTTFAGGLVINEDGLDQDTRIEGDTDANLGYFNAGEDSFTVGANTSAGFKFRVVGSSSLDGAFVFNEAGANVDARFEGDTEVNLWFLDASADSIGVGTNTPDSKLHIVGTLHNTGIFTSDSGQVRNWNVQTGNYTILTTDFMVEGAPASGGLTLTLPAASGVATGHRIKILTGTAVSGSNTMTVSRAGSDTVNGGTTVVLNRASIETTAVRTSSTTWRLYQ